MWTRATQWGSGTAGKAGAARPGEFPANLAEVTVAVDVLALMPVLQLVVFDVKPQGLHDGGPGLCVHSQQPCQSGVQLVLRRLGMEGSQRRSSCETPMPNSRAGTGKVYNKPAPVPEM